VIASRCAVDRGGTGSGKTNISLEISTGDDDGAESLTRDAYLALPARAERRVGMHRRESTVGETGRGTGLKVSERVFGGGNVRSEGDGGER
jgi:hypothetical protein